MMIISTKMNKRKKKCINIKRKVEKMKKVVKKSGEGHEEQRGNMNKS